MNQNKSVKIRFKGFTEAWEQRNLFDYIQKITDFRGRTPKKLGMEWSEKGIPALSALNVKDGYIDLSQDIHFGNQKLYKKWMAGNELHKGQVLFTTEAPMGNVAQVPDNKKYILSQRTIAFDVKKDILSEDFLAILLRSPSVFRELTALSTGGTAKGVSQKTLAGVKVKVPKLLEEQKEIAELFSRMNGCITLHQRKLNRFQKIRTTFLQKMFPKNGETKPAIRLTGFNADWEQEKLQNFAVRITRKNIKKQNNRPLTISAQHGLVDQTVYFNNRVAAQDVSNYYLIKKGEFAYNRSTSKDAPVGAVRRLVDYEEGVLSTLYLVFSITDPQHVDPNYLSYFFETTGWHSWILERAAEGARNHGLLNVSSQDFLSLPVMLPSSLEEQQKIGEFFQKIDDCIILLERQADLLKQIKSSLLLNMFPPSNAE